MILVIDGVKRESVEGNAMTEWKLSIFNIVDKRILKVLFSNHKSLTS